MDQKHVGPTRTAPFNFAESEAFLCNRLLSNLRKLATETGRESDVDVFGVLHIQNLFHSVFTGFSDGVILLAEMGLECQNSILVHRVGELVAKLKEFFDVMLISGEELTFATSSMNSGSSSAKEILLKKCQVLQDASRDDLKKRFTHCKEKTNEFIQRIEEIYNTCVYSNSDYNI